MKWIIPRWKNPRNTRTILETSGYRLTRLRIEKFSRHRQPGKKVCRMKTGFVWKRGSLPPRERRATAPWEPIHRARWKGTFNLRQPADFNGRSTFGIVRQNHAPVSPTVFCPAIMLSPRYETRQISKQFDEFIFLFSFLGLSNLWQLMAEG